MGGPEGELATRVGVRCRNFGQNFGQFHLFWAILRQNLGRFHIFWAILRQNFGQFHDVWQFCLVKYSERWTEKPSQFVRRPFFLRSPQFGQKKRLICQSTFKSFFGQNFGDPPNHFELLRPCSPVT